MRTEDVLDQIDGALEDWQVGPDAMRCGAPAGAGLVSLPDTVTLALMVDTGAFEAAMARTQEILRDFVGEMAKLLPAMSRLLRALEPYDEHHPRPLCIDGHEYRRRQRNRRRR